MRLIKKSVWLSMGMVLSAQLVTSTAALAQDKMSLVLDWFVNPDHAHLIIAQQKGFFKEQGLDIELIEPADPSMPPKLVAAGQADLAVTYQPQLHMQVDEGLPLTRISSLVDSPLNIVLVLGDSPIQTMRDLKGKKVGFSVGGFEDVLLGSMLKHNGLNLSDVELINVNWSLSPSLMAKKTDAVIGAFRNFDLNQLAMENYTGRAFNVEDHGIPMYDELIVVVNNKDRGQSDKWQRFNRALKQSIDYIQEHPDQAWEAFQSYKPKELNTELNRRIWKDTLPYLAKDPSKLQAERYQQFAQFMLKNHLIKMTPAIESYAIQP